VTQAARADGTISLPKGGGALQAIGEAFTADLHTGTGNVRVPLGIPPGRNGLTPALDLAYSSGHGQSPFCLGWRVSVSEIARKTAKGVPTYDDTRDVFMLSEADELVAVRSAPTETHYRPATEGNFARIVHDRSGGSNRWRVLARDGTVSHYEAALVDPSNQAALADPSSASRIFAW
jgi:hypothetical protein